MRRLLAPLLVVLAAAFNSGCETSSPSPALTQTVVPAAAKGSGKGKVYSLPYNSVWSVALDRVRASGLTMVSSNFQTGTIVAQTEGSLLSDGDYITLYLEDIGGGIRTRVEVVNPAGSGFFSDDWEAIVLANLDERLGSASPATASNTGPASVSAPPAQIGSGIDLSSPTETGLFERGVDAWNRKDYANAARFLRPLALQGNAVAGYYVGIMYADGREVERDPVKSAEWFRFAAERGHALAQIKLAEISASGTGVLRDPAQAVKWFTLAAEGLPAKDAQMRADIVARRNELMKTLTPDQLREAQRQLWNWQPK